MTHHILLIDNDPTLTYVAERYFKQAGFRVSVAHTSETGFVLSQTEDVSLAVVDYRMPTMNGVELLRLMRKKKDILPAILCTAFPGDIDHGAVEDAQTRVLPKDQGVDALVALARRLLGGVTA